MLARTSLLRRRLRRLLADRGDKASSLLNLRAVAERVDYWCVRSGLGGLLQQYAAARVCFPSTYLEVLKLRLPYYVRVLLENEFPRLQVAARIAPDARSLYYGPFPSRGAAEQFEAACLDQFLLRRCQEDLVPSPAHPGCVYGEMRRCLRPCQDAVSPDRYAEETGQVVQYIRSGGQSLLQTLSAARDNASAELDFEQAAQLHHRYERARALAPASGELARALDGLHGICVVPTRDSNLVELWPVAAGMWQDVVEVEPHGAAQPALDARPPFRTVSSTERQEHLAILTRWFHSSWRDGEWLPVEDWSRVPYRRLNSAVARVARAVATT